MKKSKLHTIKDSGFKTPKAYLENFDARLFQKLAGQNNLSEVVEPGFKVPEHYFEDFDATLQLRLNEIHQRKVRSLNLWRNAAYISGVAAALVLMIAVLTTSTNHLEINQVETASIEEYLNNENLNTYDIAALLDPEDMVLEDFVASALSESSLENYLLDNTTIEDLINEK